MVNFIMQRYHKRGPVVIVDVPNAIASTSGTSSFSAQCVVVGVNVAVDSALANPDRSVGIITHYTASKKLLTDCLEAKCRDLVRSSQTYKASIVEKIAVYTTDGVQGKEFDIVVGVTAVEGPNSFGWERRRLCVFLTRMRIAFFLVCKSYEILSFPNKNNPMVRVVLWAGPERTFSADRKFFANNMESFNSIQF